MLYYRHHSFQRHLELNKWMVVLSQKAVYRIACLQTHAGILPGEKLAPAVKEIVVFRHDGDPIEGLL